MSKALETIEISRMPELVRIVEEVNKTRTSRILSRRRKPLAILRPIKRNVRRARRVRTAKDMAAFRASAGAWRDLVDVERLKKNIYESRSISTRPLVAL